MLSHILIEVARLHADIGRTLACYRCYSMSKKLIMAIERHLKTLCKHEKRIQLPSIVSLIVIVGLTVARCWAVGRCAR